LVEEKTNLLQLVAVENDFLTQILSVTMCESGKWYILF